MRWFKQTLDDLDAQAPHLDFPAFSALARERWRAMTDEAKAPYYKAYADEHTAMLADLTTSLVQDSAKPDITALVRERWRAMADEDRTAYFKVYAADPAALRDDLGTLHAAQQSRTAGRKADLQPQVAMHEDSTKTPMPTARERQGLHLDSRDVRSQMAEDQDRSRAKMSDELEPTPCVPTSLAEGAQQSRKEHRTSPRRSSAGPRRHVPPFKQTIPNWTFKGSPS